MNGIDQGFYVMSSNIALVSAFPSGGNPGMLSVELAFASIENLLGEAFKVTRFCTEQSFELKAGTTVLRWEHLENARRLSEYDKIIYWGDFLHWNGYGASHWLSRQKKRHPGEKKEKLLDQWYDCLLLEGHKDLRSKSILFGGTLYCLSAGDLVDSRYRTALANLCTDAQMVRFRDQLSATLISGLTKSDASHYGCDCAFLLDTTLFPNVPYPDDQIVPEGCLLYSFARSGADEALATFAKQLGSRLRLPVTSFTWFSNNSDPNALLGKLKSVRRANVVITDIYHLAVSAIRERKAVFCVGQGCSYAIGTLADKKKELFFRQILAERYYLFCEMILKGRDDIQIRESLLDHCVKHLNEGEALGLIVDQHTEHVAKTKAQLVDGLKAAVLQK